MGQSTQHHRFRFACAVVSVSARGAGAPRTGAGELHRQCFASVGQCAGAQIWPRLACASCWISRRLRLGLATVFVAVVARARVVVAAPWHWSGAARCVVGQWPAASHVVCAPAHPCASPLRGISLARWSARPPPVGAPSARAPLLLGLATGLIAGHPRNTGATGLTACMPAWPLAYFSVERRLLSLCI